MSFSPASRGRPLTVEALRVELAACLGQDFPQTFRDDLLSELREMHKDHADKVTESTKLVMREAIEEMQQRRPRESLAPVTAHQRSSMEVIAEASVSTVKSATDWVMKRKVNPAFFIGGPKHKSESTQNEESSSTQATRRSYQKLPESTVTRHSQQAQPDRSRMGSHGKGLRFAQADVQEVEQFISDGSEQGPAEETARPSLVPRPSEFKLLPRGVVEGRIAPRRTCGACKGAIKKWVDHPYFEQCSCLLILISIICVGMQTDLLARDHALPGAFLCMGHFIILVFSLELLLRLSADGLQFFSGTERLLNWFDFIIVMFCVGWFWFSTFFSEGARCVPTLSVLRLARILSFACKLSFVGGLRMLIVSIASSIKSLVWVIVLLITLTYALGVMLTHVVIATKLSKHDLPPEAKEDLDRLFGSIQKSMLSLFEAISEGTHWAEVMDPLVQHCSPWLKPVFLCYIIFSMFALLNVVTGLFVDVAMTAAIEDKKMMIAKSMCNTFLGLDADQSGAVSKEEFVEVFNDPQMAEYLKELDIDAAEADMLFGLLDSDDSGEINAEELVGGCLRLHGQAKALELAAFMHQFNKFTLEFADWRDNVDLQLGIRSRQQKRTGRQSFLTASMTARRSFGP